MPKNFPREKSRQISKSRNGFTLVEIIIAFALLSIILVAFLTVFTTANTVNSYAQNNSQATYMAQAYVEKMYNESSKGSYTTVSAKLTDGTAYGFSRIGTSEEFEKTENGYYIKIKFELKSSNVYKVLIRIYNKADTEGQKQIAQIENVFSFKV